MSKTAIRARIATDSSPPVIQPGTPLTELQLVAGNSAAMAEVQRHLWRVQRSDVTVCLCGETGTGKDFLARLIHERGARRRGPFIPVNCLATLQEPELFGHLGDALGGAQRRRAGKFEQANHGTLFLDNVDELSLPAQAMLLRVVEDRRIHRANDSEDVPVDMRIICATRGNLERKITKGAFRADLFFRLVGYVIDVPALRNRSEDIPELVTHFLQEYATARGRDAPVVSASALAALSRYAWPGNVRELRNVVECALLGCDGNDLDLWHLPPELRMLAADRARGNDPSRLEAET